MSLAQAGEVVAEDDVEHPVQPVFDAPVAADGLGGAFGGKAGGGDVVPGLGVGPGAAPDVGLDADEAGGIGQAAFAGEAALAGEPADLTRDADGALLDAAMALVDVGVDVERAGRGGGKGGLDLGAQRRSVGLDGEQVVGAGITDGLGDGAVGGDRIDRDQGAPCRPSAAARRSSSAGIAASSLDLSATASWPSTSRAVVAKAETGWIGPASARRSWLRREVLPSIATTSGRSGQASRTRAEKAAWNSPGLIRFIRMVSHRPPGTPSA